MSTANSHPETAPAPSPWLAVFRGWDRFWFTPADPTVLGLVRICAGLMLLYMHLVYTWDLQAIFGPDAWINLKTLNDVRENAPLYTRPTDKWQETPSIPPPPYSKEEQDYILRFDGWHPDQTFAKGTYGWSIWYHVTDPTWIRVVHVLVLINFALFTIGFGTRISSVLAWLANLSYLQRSLYGGLFGVDTITNLALLYLMIGPSGAALSVDRLIARYWHTWRALRARASSRKAVPVDDGFFRPGEALEIAPPAPRVSANLALRLLQVHICIVYLASGLSKLQGPAWWNGTAIWSTMANADMSPVHYSLYVAFIRYLCDHRWLWELFMSGGALFTLIFEISFPYLIWNRYLRWTMIVSALMLHTGIALFMGLTTFSLMMISVVLAFTPPETVHWLADKLTRGWDRFHLVFAPKERGQVRAASIIHAFDVAGQFRLQPQRPQHGSEASAEDSQKHLDGITLQRLHLIGDDGVLLTGYPLFERVVRSLRLLWPTAWLTWVPGVSSVGRAWYPEEAESAKPAPAVHEEQKVPR